MAMAHGKGSINISLVVKYVSLETDCLDSNPGSITTSHLSQLHVCLHPELKRRNKTKLHIVQVGFHEKQLLFIIFKVAYLTGRETKIPPPHMLTRKVVEALQNTPTSATAGEGPPFLDVSTAVQVLHEQQQQTGAGVRRAKRLQHGMLHSYFCLNVQATSLPLLLLFFYFQGS